MSIILTEVVGIEEGLLKKIVRENERLQQENEKLRKENKIFEGDMLTLQKKAKKYREERDQARKEVASWIETCKSKEEIIECYRKKLKTLRQEKERLSTLLDMFKSKIFADEFERLGEQKKQELEVLKVLGLKNTEEKEKQIVRDCEVSANCFVQLWNNIFLELIKQGKQFAFTKLFLDSRSEHKEAIMKNIERLEEEGVAQHTIDNVETVDL